VKRLGPELKMPKLKGSEMKVPPFLSDLYFDLRDRRLLPLVALILIGIVAAPVLLKGSASEPEAGPAPIAGAGSAEPAGQTLTVVRAEPGLRNYRKRLAHRSPTNPFEQRFDGARLKGSQLNEVPPTGSSGASTETSSSTGTSQETIVTSPSGAPGGETGGAGGEPGKLVFFTFAVDVQISRIETKADGTVDETEPNLHQKVLPPTALPGKKAPVVTYLGLGSKVHLPMFMVSNDVSEVDGKNQCISAGAICQLIMLQPGKPEVFVYGPNKVRYKIVVTHVEPIVDGHS
jgi:hypothetical protein